MPSQRPPTLRKLSATKQRQLDALLEKNAEGIISAKQRQKLDSLVNEAEDLMVANAKRLAEFAREQSQPPASAIPVTVWIAPQHTER